MMFERPRVIFDCNILFQAFLTPQGPAKACIEAVENHRVTALVTSAILDEAYLVLTRPFVIANYPHARPEQIRAFLEELSYFGEFHRIVPLVMSYPSDPKDEPYLNLAIAAKADFIVTREKDLLSLQTSHSIEAKQFRALTSNRLRVLTPIEFLRLIASQNT